MTSLTSTSALALPASAPPAARAVFALLGRLRHGTLDLRLPDGSAARLGSHAPGEPRAALRLRNWNPCAAALRKGDIGFAESYIAGDWDTPDMPALLGLLIANRADIEAVVYGRWWGALLYRARHLLQRNSRRGSRRNIHAHYDLGNAFYSLWLDPSMNYSSAWFEGDPGADLVAAQHAKMRRALAECAVQRGQRVLEIGCGWGALAELCGREIGACVTGVTLSTEQLGFANERLEQAGLAGDLRLQDYRDLARSEGAGSFDAVVSIEMFEAVGREYWPSFFETVRQQLKPGGRACIQSITIRDDLFDRYVGSTDFIQQYIFPGGLLPSCTEFRAAAAKAGLAVVTELDFGLDYAETVRRWRTSFRASEAAVRGLGFDTRFIRTWDFYLAYCEAAFAAGNTSVVQFTLQHKA
ncbi:MAG: cyclopropane-fatty-acyl-phospholipid synthase family protein [Burkholderiaceae bacterium]